LGTGSDSGYPDISRLDSSSLSLHPGRYYDQAAILRWTVPEGVTSVHVKATFHGEYPDPYSLQFTGAGTTTLAGVLFNGDDPNSTPEWHTITGNEDFVPEFDITVNSGDTIDFVVGWNGSGGWDRTNLSVQITTLAPTWVDFGVVSADHALLLDSGTQVRYVPDGSNGETASFAFRAWDQTSGTASTGTPSYANPEPGGGTTAFSAATATARMSATSVNDAPVLAGVPANAIISEEVGYIFRATATDVDLPSQSLTFSLVGAPAGAFPV
jgi:hypothetical protein